MDPTHWISIQRLRTAVMRQRVLVGSPVKVDLEFSIVD
jgi:hypothetical protein